MATSEGTKLGRLSQAPVSAEYYQPGTLLLDKYLLEGTLGEGGMGTVWLARNVILDAPVALKLVRPDLMGEEASERLLIEARVEAKLKHPNIIRVFDFGQTERGDVFMIMEVLDGISLEDLLEEREILSPIEAVQLLLPVIDALAYAHQNGVVHRDLKPGNVFLDRVDRQIRPKLLDFGIAKLDYGESEQRRTGSGMLLGSPPYMAPEQARAEDNLDHRLDIWAVCVVLYEAISGRAAFPGEGYALLRAIVEDEVVPLEENQGGEASLWAIIDHGIAKARDARFQSMRELGAALAQWLLSQGVSEDLAGNRLSRSWGLHAEVAPESPLEPEIAVPRVPARIEHRPAAFPRASGGRALQGLALALAFLAFAPAKIGVEAASMAAARPVAIARARIPVATTPPGTVERSVVARAVAAETLHPTPSPVRSDPPRPSARPAYPGHSAGP